MKQKKKDEQDPHFLKTSTWQRINEIVWTLQWWFTRGNRWNSLDSLCKKQKNKKKMNMIYISWKQVHRREETKLRKLFLSMRYTRGNRLRYLDRLYKKDETKDQQNLHILKTITSQKTNKKSIWHLFSCGDTWEATGEIIGIA